MLQEDAGTTQIAEPFLLFGYSGLQVGISLSIVAGISWLAFNRWTAKDEIKRRGSVPRDHASFLRFHMFRTLYTLTYVGVFIFLLVDPETLREMSKSGVLPLPKSVVDVLGQSPFVILALIMSIGATPAANKIDIYRGILHKWAGTPVAARRLAEKLSDNPECFRPERSDVRTFLENDRRNLLKGLISEKNFDNDESLGDFEYSLAKLIYLNARLNEWRDKTRMRSYFKRRKIVFKAFSAAVDRVVNSCKNHMSYVDPGSLSNHAAGVRREIDDRVSECLDQAYDLIASGALAVKKSEQGTKASLEWFGYFGLPSDRQTFMKALAIFFSTATLVMFGSAVWVLMSHLVSPIFSQGGFASLTGLDFRGSAVLLPIMLGANFLLAMVVALGVRLLFIEKREGSVGARWIIGAAAGELVLQYALAGLLAAVVSASLSGGVIYLIADTMRLDMMERALLWGAIAGVTALFMTNYLRRGEQPVQVGRAIAIQAVATAVLVSVVALIDTSIARSGDTKLSFEGQLFMVSLGVIAGGIVGGYFSKRYRQFWILLMDKYSTRRKEGVRLHLDTKSRLMIGDQKERHQCVIVDISEGYARVEGANGPPLKKGANVNLRLPNFHNAQHTRILSGKVNKVRENGIIVKFKIDDQSKKRLASFIGERAA